jgi:hypothetical protein
MVDVREIDQLVRRLKGPGMVNRVLQNICAAEGLSKHGVKAELQARIIARKSISSLNLVVLGEASTNNNNSP